ncbi:hypothetical protein WME89_27590 [Sorangium sp. So ce321]
MRAEDGFDVHHVPRAMGYGLHDEEILGHRKRNAQAAYIRRNRATNRVLLERQGPHREVDRNAGAVVSKEKDAGAEGELQRIRDAGND